MSHRFQRLEDGRFRVTLEAEERSFLAEITTLLESVDPTNTQDPAATRLHLPVYLDDHRATDEWWRLMGDEMSEARQSDRSIFDRVMTAPDTGLVLEGVEAESLLRVINEGRLVLASRLGIQVASDFEDVDPETRMALDFLHWLLEDLTEELSRQL